MRVLDGGLKDGIPLKLRYNARSQSGYRDVVPNGDCATNGGRRPWKVQWLDKYGGAVPGIGRREYLGSYATAEEAAIALARRVQQREAEEPDGVYDYLYLPPPNAPKEFSQEQKSPAPPRPPATTRSTRRGSAVGAGRGGGGGGARGGDRRRDPTTPTTTARCGGGRRARRAWRRSGGSRRRRNDDGSDGEGGGASEGVASTPGSRGYRHHNTRGHHVTDEMIGTMGAEEALAAAAAEGLTLWRSNNVSGYRAVYHQKNVNAANGGIFEVRTKEGDNMISHHGYFRTAEHAALVFARYVRDERGEAGETRLRGAGRAAAAGDDDGRR